jgi:hypothetical protein
MAFECPWGCASGMDMKSTVTPTHSHETAWDCPYYSTVFLGAIEEMATITRFLYGGGRKPHHRARRSSRSGATSNVRAPVLSR